jgi:hypothetical protein
MPTAKACHHHAKSVQLLGDRANVVTEQLTFKMGDPKVPEYVAFDAG